MLRCVTSYFNVNNSNRVKENFIEFRKRFNAPLTVVELAFDDQPFWIEDAIQIRADQSNMMWQKERLVNIAIYSLPSKVDKVAWVDADIIFENNNWFKTTEMVLDSKPIVQLFDSVYETNDANDPVNVGEGYVYKSRQNPEYDLSNIPSNTKKDIGKYGLAWAANISAIPNGINDFSITGSSDLLQILSWEGAWDSYYFFQMSKKYRDEVIKRSFVEFLNIKGDLGYIPGAIEHLQHGPSSKRKYEENQAILYRHDFSIEEDIHLDAKLLWQWASDKHDLHQEIKDIFYSRDEDNGY